MKINKITVIVSLMLLSGCTELVAQSILENYMRKNSDKIYDAMPKTLQDKTESYQDKKNKKLCFNYFDNLDNSKKSTGLATFCEKYKEEYLKKNDK